eukprot:TRINITY_DN10886_c0_g1_i4.p1 TRINITY_DN10886_c0_g1~~TRINITY_DN10886_c0_g1_i4.p1  ORF type:complete len:174 (+),score=44.28 TRINITY_DN10886_c0_g1_i4:128-649(+)
MIRRPPRSTLSSSSAASDVYKRQGYEWHHVPQDELDEYLRKLFFVADQNGDGVLQSHEFVSLMRESALNFPDQIINQALADADTNQDGVIQCEELINYVVAQLKSHSRAAGPFSQLLAQLSSSDHRPRLKKAATAAPKPFSPDPLYQAYEKAGRLFDIADTCLLYTSPSPRDS